MPRPYPATPRVAHLRPTTPRPCLANCLRHCLANCFVPAIRGHASRIVCASHVGMNGRGRPSGSPLRWDCLSHMELLAGPRGGEALPRPYPATPRGAHRPEALPRELFVPAMNERVGMNDRGRPSGSPPTLGHVELLAGPRGGEALPRPYPATPRGAHRPEALPRELFVPAMNERVGMNDRGRPSGSPLRWDTWSVWPDRVGARHCLALIRRRPAAPTFRGIASLTTVSFWDARKGPLRANNSIAGDATGSGSWINVDAAARHRFNRTKQPRCGLAATR